MEKKLSFNKTFRYEMMVKGENPDTLVYVLHGYGQLARFFIRKFSSLNNVTLVAPEGMHRFYLEGSSGRVGASWMTKEAREDDILDNINWLNQLHKEVTSQKSYKRIILLGFSQGGATAARWMEMGNVGFDHLVLWACVYPPDLEKRKAEMKTPSVFVIGSNDEYYNGEEAIEVINFYKDAGFDIVEYSGGHDIDQDTLKDILLNLQ